MRVLVLALSQFSQSTRVKRVRYAEHTIRSLRCLWSISARFDRCLEPCCDTLVHTGNDASLLVTSDALSQCIYSCIECLSRSLTNLFNEHHHCLAMLVTAAHNMSCHLCAGIVSQLAIGRASAAWKGTCQDHPVICESQTLNLRF